MKVLNPHENDENVKYRIFVHRFDGFIERDFDTVDEAIAAAKASLKPEVAFAVHPVWLNEDGDFAGEYGAVYESK